MQAYVRVECKFMSEYDASLCKSRMQAYVWVGCKFMPECE